jgi:hypothetical protein
MSVTAIFQQLKAEVRVWTWDWMYLQSPHGSSTRACGARQETEIASLIWTFEAVVDPMALCVRAHYVLKDGGSVEISRDDKGGPLPHRRTTRKKTGLPIACHKPRYC